MENREKNFSTKWRKVCSWYSQQHSPINWNTLSLNNLKIVYCKVKESVEKTAELVNKFCLQITTYTQNGFYTGVTWDKTKPNMVVDASIDQYPRSSTLGNNGNSYIRPNKGLGKTRKAQKAYAMNDRYSGIELSV